MAVKVFYASQTGTESTKSEHIDIIISVAVLLHYSGSVAWRKGILQPVHGEKYCLRGAQTMLAEVSEPYASAAPGHLYSLDYWVC